ncbi:hypothetical protein CRYUN_Cryun10bG0066000 [Craigia yunnanensis]
MSFWRVLWRLEKSMRRRILLKGYLNQAGQLEQEYPSFAEADNTMGAYEDDEYARIMSRLEELEKEELAAENYGENDEDPDANAAESDGDEDEQTKAKEELAAENYGENDEDPDANAAESDGDEDEQTKAVFYKKKKMKVYQSQSRKPLQQSKGKDPMNEEMSSKYHHEDLTNLLACTGLTVEPVTKAAFLQTFLPLFASLRASLTLIAERHFFFEYPNLEDILHNNCFFKEFTKSVQNSKSEFDSSKAFMGNIVEHTQNLEKNLPGQNTTSSQFSGLQPSKPVSRFKMQSSFTWLRNM